MEALKTFNLEHLKALSGMEHYYFEAKWYGEGYALSFAIYKEKTYDNDSREEIGDYLSVEQAVDKWKEIKAANLID